MTKPRPPPSVRLAVWAGLGSLALPAAARADIVPPADFVAPALAPISPDIQAGFRSVVDGLLGNSTPEDRAFTLTPSIGVQELVTDNVFQASNPRRADLVTSILPAVTLSGQSRLVQANITYAPDVQLYASTGQQDQVAQLFNGSVLATAVPDTLFLTAHGYGNQQSASGNYGQNGLPYYSNQNRTNTLSFDVSPYATHRFGGLGTARAGYVFSYTDTTGNAPFNSLATPLRLGPLLPPALSQNFANGATRSNEEYADFTTGENFGRLNDSLRLDAVQYSSTGNTVLSGARRTTAIDSAGYGINRTVAALASLGYEDINYSGANPVRIRDAVWSAGFRLTPNERSVFTFTYGHRDGFDAPQASLSYAVTARLRVFGSYTEGLTTSQEEIQDSLDATTVDQFGNSIDTVTGAPALISDQLLPQQNELYRLSRFSATAITTYDRDVFSLNVEAERRKVISNGSPVNGLNGFSDRAVFGNGSWTHALTPVLSGTASVFYTSTKSETVPATSFQTVGLNLQTGYALSPTLTGTAGYYVTNQSTNVAGQNILVNAVLVGLRKSL